MLFMLVQENTIVTLMMADYTEVQYVHTGKMTT